MMKDFYVTFGQKFHREQHPQSINGVSPHPDGWFVVRAYDYDHAHLTAMRVFKGQFSGLYPSLEAMGAEYYPLGELGRVNV